MWNADWAKPAGESTSVKSVNLEAFIREYLKNTSRLRDFMVGIEKYDDEYAEWGNMQAKYIVAKQNYTDGGVTFTCRLGEIFENILLTNQNDDNER